MTGSFRAVQLAAAEPHHSCARRGNVEMSAEWRWATPVRVAGGPGDPELHRLITLGLAYQLR